ncbi:MAG: hypothetical protein K2O42_09535 [Oscillospiraceae bacterium]|nr:hypothetical protein [Oscillospiraceae bacterium]
MDVNKDDSETVWLVEPVTGKKSKFVLNYSIKGSEKKKYFCFEIPNSLTNIINIPETAEIKRIKSNTIHTFLNFKTWNENVTTFIEETIKYYVEHFEPSEKFGCCHRYKECSDARKCLHPDLFYAKACWYRKNLENGRIFY